MAAAQAAGSRLQGRFSRSSEKEREVEGSESEKAQAEAVSGHQKEVSKNQMPRESRCHLSCPSPPHHPMNHTEPYLVSGAAGTRASSRPAVEGCSTISPSCMPGKNGKNACQTTSLSQQERLHRLWHTQSLPHKSLQSVSEVHPPTHTHTRAHTHTHTPGSQG